MKSKSVEAEMTRQETLKIAGELVPGADRKWRSEITDELLKVYARVLEASGDTARAFRPKGDQMANRPARLMPHEHVRLPG